MGRAVTNRENKTAAGEFRELVGMDFDEFTRQAPISFCWASRNSPSQSISRCCSLRTRPTRYFSSSARD